MRWNVLLFLCLFGTAFAGTIDPNIPDQKYIDYAKDFHCVLKLCGNRKDGVYYCASAVAISPNWVLTAAHVVQPAESVYVSIIDKKIKLNKIIWHKDFEENNFGFCDIALGYTKEDIGLNFYPKIYEENDEVGKVCSIAGWGVTGNFQTGSHTSDGKRRAGSNKIDGTDKNLLLCSPSITKKTSLEFLISHGDSGGGLFIDGKLAGINSCVMASDKKTDSNYSDESGHTRLSLFKPWIEEQLSLPVILEEKIDQSDDLESVPINSYEIK
jgi:hypothetical protein